MLSVKEDTDSVAQLLMLPRAYFLFSTFLMSVLIIPFADSLVVRRAWRGAKVSMNEHLVGSYSLSLSAAPNYLRIDVESPSSVAASAPISALSSQHPAKTTSGGGILDPRLIKAMKELEGADDPELSDFFADFEAAGPMASMHYLGSPSIVTRLSALMGQVLRERSRRPAPGWGRKQ